MSRAEYNKRWRAEHPELVAEQQRRYRLAHPEAMRAKSLRSYHRRKAKPRSPLSAGAAAHRRIRDSTRYRADPHFRVLKLMQRRIRAALDAQSVRKNTKTSQLLGCSGAELHAHLCARMPDGMSEADLTTGRVHIDHIRPCASFDLTDPVQQRMCFHYTNLQPLWAGDNIRKSDTV